MTDRGEESTDREGDPDADPSANADGGADPPADGDPPAGNDPPAETPDPGDDDGDGGDDGGDEDDAEGSGSGDMNLGLESLKGFPGKLLQSVLGFAGAVVFARVLGPVSFGGFYFLLSILFVVDRPVRGFGQAVQKRASEADRDRPEIVGAVLVVAAALTAVVAVAVLALRGPLTAATIPGAPAVFVALFAGFALFVPFQKLLSAEGLVGLQTWNDTLRSVLTLPLQLALVLTGAGAAGMGYGLAGATLLVVPVAWYVLEVRPTLPSRETIRSLWEYARYSTPAALVGKTYARLDVLLLGAVIGTGTVGFYEAAYKLTVPALFLPNVVVSGLMPKVSNRHSTGRPFATDVTNAVSYVSIFAVPILFGALAIPKPLLVTVFGPAYADGTVFLVGIAAYQVLASQSQVYMKTLMGIDRPDLNLRVDIVALAVNVVLGVALVFEVGAVGVVVASVLAEAARYGMAAWTVARRAGDVELLPRTLAEQVAAGAVMFLVVDRAAARVGIAGWPELVAVVGLGAAVYCTVLLVVSRRLRFTVRSILGDAVAAVGLR